jgi:malonyl-CoA/methylmalonyl-CoA synthetase
MSGQPTIVVRAAEWRGREALADDQGRYTYADLLHASAGCGGRIARIAARGERVAMLVPAGFRHVAWQWGAWRAGAVAVPLSASQAPAEWEHVLDEVAPAVVVGEGEAGLRLERLAAARRLPFLPSDAAWGSGDGTAWPDVRPDDRALVLYTSGTTSRPKGVVLTHANLEAQMAALVEAWGWRGDDRVLHVLPLNHVHGIVNVLGCALWAGACCEFQSPFDAATTWERLASGRITLFMAVPTIYARLLEACESAGGETRDRWASAARRLRLMVSGSAALPVSLLERWHGLTGHVLLERYGMTEIGMALSNPLDGIRRAGSVGMPLPGVAVRLVDEEGREVSAGIPGIPGEIEVRGPGVFREYWRRPEATSAAFRDGWFRTGDIAVVEAGSYRILGRRSVDIIKTGGYKVSALEIEEVLREHPAVADAAVVGVPDEVWGERVAAAVAPRPGAVAPPLDELRAWASDRLAKYKLPTRLVAVASLPRNALGKVVKNEVKRLFAGHL